MFEQILFIIYKLRLLTHMLPSHIWKYNRYIIKIILCGLLSIFNDLALATTIYSPTKGSNFSSFSTYRSVYQYVLTRPHLMPYLKDFNGKNKFLIIVNSKTQRLFLYNSDGLLIKSYLISTSKKGLGQLAGSFKTPIGLHKVTAKIGDNVPHYGIFRARQFTKKIWQKSIPQRKDYIVTRILSLEGLEPGINRGKNNKGQIIDSLKRGIYIHGTTMDRKLGKPSTIGCIHASSNDIVDLFNLTPVDSLVMIY